MENVNANFAEVTKVMMLITKNLTESSRPVINKAIELLKDFKLRGKTVEELMKLAKKHSMSLIKFSNTYAKKRMETLVKEGEIMFAKASKYAAKYAEKATEMATKYSK